MSESRKIKCTCGADVYEAVAKFGPMKYGCSRSVKRTQVTPDIRVSTVYFPHYYSEMGGSGGAYETIVFDDKNKCMLLQELDGYEEGAIDTHDKAVTANAGEVE